MGDSLGASLHRASWRCGSDGLVVSLTFDAGGDRPLTDVETAVAERIERYASNVLYLPTDRLPGFGDRVFYRETSYFAKGWWSATPDEAETSDVRWEAFVVNVDADSGLADIVDDDGRRHLVRRWEPVARCDDGYNERAGWCWPFEAATPAVADVEGALGG